MLTFLHISDTHISGDARCRPEWLDDGLPHPNPGAQALIDAINRLPFAFDFILHTGDVCADPLEADYLRARDMFARLPKPLFLLPGNHDSGELMRDILHDGAGMIVLRDDFLRLGEYAMMTLDSAVDGNVHAPVISEEQIAAFSANLNSAGDSPTLVAVHHPLIETGTPWIDQEMRALNGDEIQNLLARRRDSIVGVFHGHIHQAMTTVRDGIAHHSCPSTWSNLAGYPSQQVSERDPLTPGGFNLVMARGTGCFLRRYSLPPPRA